MDMRDLLDMHAQSTRAAYPRATCIAKCINNLLRDIYILLVLSIKFLGDFLQHVSVIRTVRIIPILSRGASKKQLTTVTIATRQL